MRFIRHIIYKLRLMPRRGSIFYSASEEWNLMSRMIHKTATEAMRENSILDFIQTYYESIDKVDGKDEDDGIVE